MTESTHNVLFVDDEPQFLQLVKRIFSKENFEILTAGNGEEAIEVFKKNSRIPVMVTDFRMPRMDGDKRIEKLREISPATQSIIVSAHGEAIEACNKVSEGQIFSMIPKPVDMKYLKETIQSALKYSQEPLGS
ncbi:hypothetical protein UZ36_05960 [Candidatus Nitromaritima sp. SCGC AAA799-C22]|nr:hypothetical protein UZ36_05960 [Candidatus Nitromaritima sp. SCGC AAA799-C22]